MVGWSLKLLINQTNPLTALSELFYYPDQQHYTYGLQFIFKMLFDLLKPR